MSCDCETCRERWKRLEIEQAARRERKRIARLGRIKEQDVREETLSDTFARDVAACERMRRARAEEPLAYSSRSCLGPGRPFQRIYTQGRGIGPGGET